MQRLIRHMDMQYLIAMLVCVTALASYLNHRFVKLPKSIGLTVISLALSLFIMAALAVGQQWLEPLRNILAGVNFSHAVMNGMLSYLLFANALHINSVELSQHRKMVGTLATVSVLMSCLLIGFLLWVIASSFGVHFDLIYFLLFGALIAPTDPVCVINAMKTCKVPPSIRMRITGEALFNDAAGILLFVVLVQVLDGQVKDLSPYKMALELVRQGLGGIVFGYLLGRFVAFFIRRANEEEAAILLTLALTTGGYILALHLGVSGPISMVIAGLVIGHSCRRPHFSANTTKQLYNFWDLVDSMLNSFLFTMIGLELLSIDTGFFSLLLGVIAFGIIIIARLVSVGMPMVILEPLKKFNWRTLTVMTWGGMRGGVSIALALSMPDTPGKSTVLSITYGVVIASIVVQGLSLQPMLNRLFPRKPAKAPTPPKDYVIRNKPNV